MAKKNHQSAKINCRKNFVPHGKSKFISDQSVRSDAMKSILNAESIQPSWSRNLTSHIVESATYTKLYPTSKNGMYFRISTGR